MSDQLPLSLEAWRATAGSDFPVFELARPTALSVSGQAAMRGSNAGGHDEARFDVGSDRFVTVRTYHRPQADAGRLLEAEIRQRELIELQIHSTAMDRNPTLPSTVTFEQADESVEVDGRLVSFSGVSVSGRNLRTLTAVLTERLAVFLLVAGVDEPLALRTVSGPAG